MNKHNLCHFTSARMTFPLHYFVKISILKLVLLIPDMSIIQYKYLTIARPWWCSQWHFCFIAFSVGRKRDKGRWADSDREGGNQGSAHFLGVLFVSHSWVLLPVNNKQLLRVQPGVGGQSSPTWVVYLALLSLKICSSFHTGKKVCVCVCVCLI